ncbi:MAG: hypothetical protein R3Y53_02585 [Bacillota bacterium]
MIEALLKNKEVVERFYSKRNVVELVKYENELYVLKRFQNLSLLEKEVEILTLLDCEMCVPVVVDTFFDCLLLEYIDGELYLDRFMRYEENDLDCDDLVKEMLIFLQLFYSRTKTPQGQRIVNDVNFRNYIFRNETIIGFDFEQAKFGEIEEDIGKIMSFALMYSPENTPWKQRFAECFLRNSVELLQLDKEKIEYYALQEMNAIKERRKNK